MIVEETLGEIQTWDRIFYSTISDIARSRFGRTPSLPKALHPRRMWESEARESNPGWKL
jgi:hypothetical protein